jgi:hypothetical protein
MFNNVIYFIQMLATINTPKVQAPFGVSLLHLVLIIQGYNQNYMKYIYNKKKKKDIYQNIFVASSNLKRNNEFLMYFLHYEHTNVNLISIYKR